jgi:hypothetical protein
MIRRAMDQKKSFPEKTLSVGECFRQSDLPCPLRALRLGIADHSASAAAVARCGHRHPDVLFT